MSHKFDTPILLIAFNRPDVTRVMFEKIKELQPTKLYINVDGPRLGKPKEYKKVEEVRRILTDVNWECDVKTNFHKNNLGCKLGVSNGLKWFFEQEEMGIILEDDLLPDISFFYFCAELLVKYKENKEIVSINGSNLGFYDPKLEASYFFSKFINMWGWATWRRTIQDVDFEMKDWIMENNKELLLDKILKLSEDEIVDLDWVNYWKIILNKTATGKIDTWDYQILFSALKKGQKVIVPKYNLVRNIGHGLNATHTKNSNNPLGYIPNLAIERNIIHANDFSIKPEYDDYLKYFWCNLHSTKYRHNLEKQITIIDSSYLIKVELDKRRSVGYRLKLIFSYILFKAGFIYLLNFFKSIKSYFLKNIWRKTR